MQRISVVVIIVALGFSMLIVTDNFVSIANAGEEFVWVNDSETKQRIYKDYVYVLAGEHANGSDVFVCRARQKDGQMHSGKLHEGKCYVPYDGDEKKYGYGSYEVLLTATEAYRWISIYDLSTRKIEEYGIRGGTSNGRKAYICAVSFQRGIQAGKYDLTRNSCYFSYGGKERERRNNFWVLMRN